MLGFAPVRMPAGPVPDGQHGSRCVWVINQLLLQGIHRQLMQIMVGTHGQGRSQSSGLADVEDQWLQPGRPIGDVADAEALLGGEQIGDLAADESLKRNAEGSAGPAPTPATALRSQRPVVAGVMVIIGVGAHGDARGGQAAASCLFRNRQQIQFGHHRLTEHATPFPPVRHQGEVWSG